jgi:hypothetical protein
MQIHIFRDGKQFGPYSEADVREYLDQGSLSPTDLAWHDGLESWTGLNQIISTPKFKGTFLHPPQKVSALRSPFHLKRSWLINCFVALISLIALYICSPYYAAYSLQKALRDGNQDELAKDIDFPPVRTSLKADIDKFISESSPGSLFATVASFAIRTGLDNAINFYFTPAGLASLANKSDNSPPSTPDVVGSAKAIISGMLGLNGSPPKSQGFESLDDFVIEESQAKLHLHFYGWGWKLDRIELAPNFDIQALTSMSQQKP